MLQVFIKNLDFMAEMLSHNRDVPNDLIVHRFQVFIKNLDFMAEMLSHNRDVPNDLIVHRLSTGSRAVFIIPS